MRTKILFILIMTYVTLFGAGLGETVWQSLNAGCGGNIQSISLDPVVPGRMFLSSDMEGHYISNDYGEKWTHIGEDLSFSYVNNITADPKNSERIYTGTIMSLEISNDGGKHWDRVAGIADSIGEIVIDPLDNRRIFALPGQRQRWGKPFGEDVEDIKAGIRRGCVGEQDFYLSEDFGKTWKKVKWSDKIGRRDILSFDVLGKTCVMGAVDGVKASSDGGLTWKPIEAPKNTGDCLGAELSPDGKTLYAAFRVAANGQPAIKTTSDSHDLGVAGHSELFAKKMGGDENWINLSKGANGFTLSSGATMYWRPRLDPKSTAIKHVLLMGTYRPQHGLWEVDVDWSGAEPVAEWKRVLYYNSATPGFKRSDVPFDYGWEQWGISAEDYHFTPNEWIRKGGKDYVFTTGGETLFRIPRKSLDDMSKWQPIYTKQVGKNQGVPTYRTRGADCLFVFSGDAYKDYAIMSVGDNCILESWDGGYSWSLDGKPGIRNTSRSNSDLILTEGLESPMVIAHAAVGWGANESPGAIWAKRLIHNSPEDKWVMIAGGENERMAGLPGGTYNQLVVDPFNPKKVYVGLKFDEVYVIDDIDALYNAAVDGTESPRVYSITKRMPAPRPRHVTYDSCGLVPDPNKKDQIYLAGNKNLWRGNLQKDVKTWSWKRILPDNGSTRFTALSMKGKTYIVATKATTEGESEEALIVSADEGETWSKLLDFESVKGLRNKPAWYKDGMYMVLAGVVADDSTLVFSYQTARKNGRRPYGIFRAEFLENGTLQKVSDITADAHWAYPVKCRIRDINGERYLYMATRGNGFWRRELK